MVMLSGHDIYLKNMTYDNVNVYFTPIFWV